MSPLSGKNILLAIPKSQFDEEELFTLRSILQEAGARIVVLSKSGQEARGMCKTRFQPDGMIVDWNKQPGVSGKYHAVLVVGGKGSAKSLWDDPILPQILTDHYRAGSVIGAIGQSVVVLARASFPLGDAAAPEDETVVQEMQACGWTPGKDNVVRSGRIITARGAEAAPEFAQEVMHVLLEPNAE